MFKPRLHADRSFKEGGRYLIIQYQYILNIFIGIAAGEGRGAFPTGAIAMGSHGWEGSFCLYGEAINEFLVGRGVELFCGKGSTFCGGSGGQFFGGNMVLLGVGFWWGGELWAGGGG